MVYMNPKSILVGSTTCATNGRRKKRERERERKKKRTTVSSVAGVCRKKPRKSFNLLFQCLSTKNLAMVDITLMSKKKNEKTKNEKAL